MGIGFSPVAYTGFSAVFRPWMKRRFSDVSVRLPSTHVFNDIPLMVVANHVSWWDGFLLIELQRALRPHAPFHTVMLESELERHPFLRRIGAIGVDPARPSTILAAMREVSTRVEKQPDSMVFFFPQGKIWPSHRRPLGFRRGIEVFCEAIGNVVVMPVAIHIEPLNQMTPHAFVRAGEPLRDGDEISALTLEARVQKEIDELLALLAQHGENTPTACIESLL